MRLLFVGDVVGSPGRRALSALLPELREKHALDWVVVNGENSAGGLGITEKIAREFLDGLGVDVVTLGNHAFRHRDVYDFLDRDSRIIRPANYFRADPGRGHTVVEKDGKRLAVINLSGTVFVEAARSPFAEVDAILAELRGKYDWVMVDFHAEATSEKVAMGWHLDGRALGCFGTHTHVPTADGRVLPGGTAYITDTGMTGARSGVIGMDRDLAVRRFMTAAPVKLESAQDDPWLNGVIVEAGANGLATSFEQVLLPLQSA